MYNVWLCDLKKAIAALEEKVPNMQLFSEIKGNVNGDFIIKYENTEYVIKHTDFSVWELCGGNGCGWCWVEVK